MTWQNYSDALNQLVSAGLDVDCLVVGSERPVRCRERGGDREKRGWYWLSEIGLETNGVSGQGVKARYIVGSYGIFRGNDAGKRALTLSRGAALLSAGQRSAIRAMNADNARRVKAIREKEIARAATSAAAAWAKYLPAAAAPSDYLVRKGVGAHGVRYSPSGNGTMAIPMRDAAGKIWGLQIVRGKDRGDAPEEPETLEKRYWPRGMSKLGRYHLIGQPGSILLLAEGYATAATLYEATGLPAVVAFDAGNLLPVALSLQKTYPNAYLMVCADDDYLTNGNPGVSAARSAALAVRGGWVKPAFPADRAGQKLTDFNDLARFPGGGLPLVRAQVEAALSPDRLAARFPARPDRSGQAVADDGRADEKGPRRAASVMGLDDLVARFVPIDDGTGEFVFDFWTNKIARRAQMVALLPAGTRAEELKRHPVWIGRGAYFIDQIGFDPEGSDPKIALNTWKGWPMKPAPGSCERLLELLRYLCGNEERPDEICAWLLQWMAYPLQHPGAKMASAVMMHGPQGSGKSTVFQALSKIYGDYATVLNQRGLEDRFNVDWADSRLFLLAEEIVTRAEMWHIKNELKELVTGEWIRVNPKYSAAYRQKNHLNVVYLSNEGQPLPIDNDDRRHLVIYTPPPISETFYDEVCRETENGGVAAFYDYLLKLDTSDFHPKKRPPMTQSKQRLIDLSLPSEAIFMKEWRSGQLELREGEPLPFCPCTGRQLYGAYKKWCALSGVVRPRDETQFIGYVGRQPGWQAGKAVSTLNTLSGAAYKNRKMVIPSPEAFAEAALAGAKTIAEADKARGRWLTECFFAFGVSLGEVP